jgi:hypothetical protein
MPVHGIKIVKHKAKPRKVRKLRISVAKAKPKSKRKAGAQKGSGLFGRLGGVIGSVMGGAPGRAVGMSAGNWLSRVTGMGSYRIKKPIQRNSLMGSGVPHFNGSSGAVISHAEFLTDVSGTVAFTNTVYPINVGIGTTFPWLAAIAANFEQYELLGCLFVYRPTCATAVGSTNTALGTVVMATDYDALDSSFTNKQQMEAYDYACSGSPTETLVHPVECKPRYNTLATQYIRNGNNPTTSDLRFYDMGNFQLATAGMQAGNVIGELWVTYHVRLIKPKLPTPVGVNLPFAHVHEYPLGTSSATHLIGTAPTTSACLASGSNLPLTIGDNTIILPLVGDYLICASMVATTGPTTNFGFSYGANLSVGNSIFSDSSSTTCQSLTSGSDATTFRTVRCSAAGTSVANQITLNGCSTTASGKFDLIIVQISSNLALPLPVRVQTCSSGFHPS